MDSITESSSIYGLDININKTKFMIISKENIIEAHININKTRIEKVHQYQKLDTIINKQ